MYTKAFIKYFREDIVINITIIIIKVRVKSLISLLYFFVYLVIYILNCEIISFEPFFILTRYTKTIAPCVICLSVGDK